MALYYAAGWIRAYFNKELSSYVVLKDIARKGVIFVVLIVAVSLDELLDVDKWILRTLVCYFYKELKEYQILLVLKTTVYGAFIKNKNKSISILVDE